MNVQLDISLSLWHKNAFMNLNRFNWLRYAVIHMYSIQYCNEEGIVCRGGETLQSAVFILLSFAHTKKKFCFLLHGSPFLLSVPFEDVFQDDVAIDLHSFLMLHSMSMSDISSRLVNVVII